MSHKIIVMAMVMILSPLMALSQFTFKGKIIDAQTKEVLPFATIQFGEFNTLSKMDGSFMLTNINKGSYKLKITYVGYTPFLKTIKITKNSVLEVKMEYSHTLEPPVVIIGNRASDNTGTSFTNVTKMDIKKADVGMDLPYVLDMTPSLVTTSDAGAGVGYTGMRIRGSDLSRINITVNGIPFNDPESQGAWFVDLPDFAGSLNSVQIQRGVGTSVNGPSAFGASIDMQTNALNTNPYSEISLSYGSFNTQRYRLATSTGLINDKFTFDVRLSKLYSDGYIDRAFSDMNSFFISGAYYGKKSILRMNVFSGKERTYQAWYGVPKDSLETNRTMNPYTYDNETDNYVQTHYQLLYSYQINKRWLINAALHYTKGSGYYENYKSDKKFSSYGLPDYIIGNDTIMRTNLVQQKWLDNDFYGLTFSANYTVKKLTLNIGGAANNYDGDHYGKIIWSQYSPMNKGYEWYRNKGLKTNLNFYAKANYLLTDDLVIYGDLQYRKIDYSISGIHDDLHDLTSDYNFNFINPKMGVVYHITSKNQIYGSMAMANKEPSRTNYTEADADYSPKSEHLLDYEMGYAYNRYNKLLRVNFYFMNYKDQLVETGKVNNVGSAILTNVDKSYRRGVELIAGWKINKYFDWDFNTTLSQNVIEDFTEYVDNWDTWGQESAFLGNTNISFSPSVILKNSFNLHVLKNLDISLNSRYVGRQYIDNSHQTNGLFSLGKEISDRSINPYFVSDLRFNYSLKSKLFKNLGFNFSINNIFNERYETHAWVYRYLLGGDEYEMNGYFPQAGINFVGGITLRF